MSPSIPLPLKALKNMFHIFATIIGIYVALRLVPPLRWKAPAKWIAGIFIVLLSQYHFVGRMVFGNMASPELPTGVLIFMGWLFGSFFLLAVFFLLKDMFSFVSLLWRRIRKTQTPPFSPNRVNAVLLVAALVLSGVGVWQAVRVPDVKTVDISIKGLPPEMEGLKVVQLSDLHASRLLTGERNRAVVDKTNAIHPDLILITGDLVDGTVKNRANDVAPFRDFRAKYGVFSIPGNHEYYSDYVQWMNAFDGLGLNMLKNGHVVLIVKDHPLVIAGITDRVAPNFGLPEPDIKKALDGIPEGAPVILMVHQPRDAAKNAQAGVTLQLSGHTHGGQILGAHWLVQLFNEGFVSGLYDAGDMKLYVSNGTGLWNGFPIRLGRPAEITEIVLHAG